MGRLIGVGLGALGAYGVVSALLDGNDARLPEADHTAAARVADATIASIDWTRPILAITVPGTKNADTGILRASLLERAGADNVSYASLGYPASATGMVESVAVGKEALRRVLDEVQRRDPTGTRYHVALQGESQGAWVINDTLAERPFRGTVDRVALFGMPAATTHDDLHERDDRIQLVNHDWDAITWPFLGSAQVAPRAAGFALGGGLPELPWGIMYALVNPVHVAVLGVTTLRLWLVDGDRSKHPHIYDGDMDAGARFLLDGAARS